MRSWRPLRLAVLLTAVVLTGATAGCDDPVSPAVTDLARAMDRWEAHGPRDYSFDYQVKCFCSLDTRPLRIEVRDGEVVRALPAGSEEVLDDGAALDGIPTIDDLFKWILDAIEHEAAQIDATYDEQLGYPHDVFIDRIKQAIDDEFSFEVTNFQALSSR
jgi:hypothetical protein